MQNTSLSQQIEAARGKLAALQSAADDAEAEAQRWATTFEREPSEEAFSRKAVTAQKAQNARAEVGAFERDTLGRLLAQERQAEREAIARDLHAKEEAVRERFARAIESVAAGVRELDAAIAVLAELHGPRLEAQGAGVPLYPLSLTNIIGELSGRLREFEGSGAHEIQHTHAVLTFEKHTQSPCVVLQFNRPTHSVPTPLL